MTFQDKVDKINMLLDILIAKNIAFSIKYYSGSINTKSTTITNK